MTTRARPRSAPFVVAVTALALTACGGEAPPQVDPSPASTPASTPTPTSEEANRPEQRQLTAEEVAAALPSRAQAPSGYARDPRSDDEPDPDWTPTAQPESCLALYQQTSEQSAFREAHHVAGDHVRYTRDDGRRPAPSLIVTIRSYDKPYPKEFFDEAGAVLGECTKHVHLSSPDSSSEDWHATSIPTPTVGQQTFGVRIGRPEIGLAWDYLYVRSGHNVIIVAISTTYEGTNDKRLSTYAQGVLDDLGKTP